jgi:hypothetical protein
MNEQSRQNEGAISAIKIDIANRHALASWQHLTSAFSRTALVKVKSEKSMWQTKSGWNQLILWNFMENRVIKKSRTNAIREVLQFDFEFEIKSKAHTWRVQYQSNETYTNFLMITFDQGFLALNSFLNAQRLKALIKCSMVFPSSYCYFCQNFPKWRFLAGTCSWPGAGELIKTSFCSPKGSTSTIDEEGGSPETD